MRDRNSLLALQASAGGCLKCASDFRWDMSDLEWMSDWLDSQKYYETIKAFKTSCATLKLVKDDLIGIVQFASKALNRELKERMEKAFMPRPKDQWDINMVNAMVSNMDALALLVTDLLEMVGDPEPEIAAQKASLMSVPSTIASFKAGPFTGLMKAMNESNILALTDMTIEVPDQGQGQSSAPALQIQMGLKPVTKSFEPVDFRSPVKIDKCADDVQGPQNLKFKSTPIFKSIDPALGEATGIVMPAGSEKRRYLDGDYFPAEVVRYCMTDYMLNSPQINRYHDEKDLANFWEHPGFRVIENWIAREEFMLNGDLVQPGDWLMTIRAITDQDKEDLMTGVFNGFSVEGWVVYWPEELMVAG